MTDEMQIVEITLSNGKHGFFSGRVLCCEDDEKNVVRVTGIKFHEAQPLPDGATFEPIVKKVGGAR